MNPQMEVWNCTVTNVNTIKTSYILILGISFSHKVHPGMLF